MQTSTQSKWGYKRAAAAVRDLDVPLETRLKADGTLEKVRHVGPASTRVVLEVLETGGSPTVEEAVAASPKGPEVARQRTLREGFLSRAQVIAVLADRSLAGAALRSYRGDLQMHSTWSDGTQTLDEICRTGLARGYAYAAVTDHSHGLPIARGLSPEAMAEQQRAIDWLNRECRGAFRLLKGIEANIRADGTLDLSLDELRGVEIVVAAPHSGLRSRDDQTARMISAASTPGVHILGHPRGRMYGSRPGISADWRKVFDAAARAEAAVEINGDPSRQDLDYRLAALAVRAGCLFALDSDAHAASEWPYAETALAHARLAGVPADRIVNTWPLDRLLEWAHRRSAAVAA